MTIDIELEPDEERAFQEVRRMLSKIPESLAQEIIAERENRF